MKNFEREINCNGGGTPHKHMLVIEADEGEVFGASKPSKRRLLYTCPVTGEKLMVIVTPPVGMSSPFNVAMVK